MSFIINTRWDFNLDVFATLLVRYLLVFEPGPQTWLSWTGLLMGFIYLLEVGLKAFCNCGDIAGKSALLF